MNDLMSLGIHRLWKDTLLNSIHDPLDAIDVACGTGDITSRIRAKYPKCKVVPCDINSDMLKNVDQGVQANAECLPFTDNTFDVYTISFGIRNCTNIQNVLKEAYRVLKPKGKFICLEFQPNPDFPFYSSVLACIPTLGQVVTGDRKSYEYFIESIKLFPDMTEFEKMIGESGFRFVTGKNLTSGICTLFTAYK